MTTWDYDVDDDGWQEYKDDSMLPDPDNYDGPRCDRCGDYYEIRRRIGTGMRRCPSCNPGPIREWWWRTFGRRWMNLRWRLKYGRQGRRGNFDDEAPF